MQKIIVGLVLALITLSSGARADSDCSRFASDLSSFHVLLKSMKIRRHFLRWIFSDQRKRCAMTPAPTKDVALCRVLRAYANDAPYFLLAETDYPSCFINADKAKAFTNYVHDNYLNVGTLVGGYCSEDELSRPAESKVLGSGK